MLAISTPAAGPSPMGDELRIDMRCLLPAFGRVVGRRRVPATRASSVSYPWPRWGVARYTIRRRPDDGLLVAYPAYGAEPTRTRYHLAQQDAEDEAERLGGIQIDSVHGVLGWKSALDAATMAACEDGSHAVWAHVKFGYHVAYHWKHMPVVYDHMATWCGHVHLSDLSRCAVRKQWGDLEFHITIRSIPLPGPVWRARRILQAASTTSHQRTAMEGQR